jgi:hypothetical protein
MQAKKQPKKAVKRQKVALKMESAEQRKAPRPSGPIPIPYPN